MAIIKPFVSVRPKVDYVENIAALPYDVYNREEAKKEVAREPLSFLSIDRAEVNFDDEISTYAPEVYGRARKLFIEFIEKEYFIKDAQSSYYIYELTMNGRSQSGIVGCASIDDYENNVIKKHENTREEKEMDRITHVDVLSAQTGPIFLAYPSHNGIKEVVTKVKETESLYDFTSIDGIRHRVWKVIHREDNTMISNGFSEIPSVYIADGHHRAASAVKVGKLRRKSNPDYTGEEEFNFFLSVLFPSDELLILPYNRVVKDLNGLTKDELLEQLSHKFKVIELGREPYQPEEKYQYGMYLVDSWYQLEFMGEVSEDSVEGLDVSILQTYVLDEILGIKDPRTDGRIDFIGGIRGLKELERRVQSDMNIAFSMYPTSINELFEVSNDNKLMPPKSTWFEPKLRSGLFIHEI